MEGGNKWPFHIKAWLAENSKCWSKFVWSYIQCWTTISIIWQHNSIHRLNVQYTLTVGFYIIFVTKCQIWCEKKLNGKYVRKDVTTWALENILKLLTVNTVLLQIIAFCFSSHFTVSQCLNLILEIQSAIEFVLFTLQCEIVGPIYLQLCFMHWILQKYLAAL